MKTTISHKIFTTAAELPENWNVLANDNIFLTREYLEVLEKSAPVNMVCHFIGLFEHEKLVGIALSQFLNMNRLESFGERDRCIKKSVRNFIVKTFAAHVLFIGNNMLTGQNAFSFDEKTDKSEALLALKAASESIKKIFQKRRLKVHITIFKDFLAEEIADFKKADFPHYYQFAIQPNMVFSINPDWKSEQDYIAALSKKYRDQYKRARKKADGVEKRKMRLEDIIAFEETIYKLYFHVARNAPFNTFFLAKNHFSTFKRLLNEKFLFYGYFLDEKLIGFNTLIKNGNAMDTYFLGYDDGIQKEKMLYLNMLYDMIAYSVNKGFCEVVFARTALEIKSSVGAKPIEMYGLIQHRNKHINKKIAQIFDYFEPKTEWKERNPFREERVRSQESG